MGGGKYIFGNGQVGSKNSLDGTNSYCLSIGDTHTFSLGSGSNNASVGTSAFVGSDVNSMYPANALIEGLTIYRRPLWDGAYGINAGNGDEIAQINNSGTGKDPTLVTGSWDVVFALPTNATTGSMGTGGTGDAWSHPHSSNLLGGTNGANGFMMNGTYTSDGFGTEVPTTYTPYGLGTTAFTANMCKRNSAGPFAAGVYPQGNWGTGNTGDVISASAGTAISGYFYSNFDTTLGSIVFWITPEWNGDDGKRHNIFNAFGTLVESAYKGTDNYLYWDHGWSQYVRVDVSSWTAGKTYGVVIRWDRTNPIQGSNYMSMSIDDVHTYGGGNAGIPYNGAIMRVGGDGSDYPANAIIEGLTIYRRVLWDGQYGINVGNGDEINLIYNSGAGKDPTLVTGSWDVVFALPTNATAGSLGVGGTGQAWSHPHSSNLLGTQGFMPNGYYGGGNAVLSSGLTSVVNAGSEAGFDNLQNGAFTVEGWYRADSFGALEAWLMTKGDFSSGWSLQMANTGRLTATVKGSVSDSQVFTSGYAALGKWMHVAMTYDAGGDKKVRVYKDGVLVGTAASGVGGSIVSDAAANLQMGLSGRSLIGVMGWARVSNSVRYSGTFTPPNAPPGVDGNTVAQWNMTEGTGTVVDNAEGTAARDGNLTSVAWVNGNWVNEGTPSVGVGLTTTEMIFNGGFKITSDEVNEGTHYDIGTTGGNDFVVRAVVNSDGTCVPKIVLSDYYAGVGETEFAWLSGTVGSGRTAPDTLIFTGEMPGAGAKTMRMKLINTASSGTCYWHQVEVLANLIDNPSLEIGSSATGSWLPTGWTNYLMESGEGLKEATNVHGGASSFNLKLTAFGFGGINSNIPAGVNTGDFVSIGFWGKNTSGASNFSSYMRLPAQNVGFADQSLVMTPTVGGGYVHQVSRHTGQYSLSNLSYSGSDVNNTYIDDVYAFKDTLVSLTVTPATLANSTESTGVRVDGADVLTQTGIGATLTTGIGTWRFKFTPRHNFDIGSSFGVANPVIAQAYAGANDYIKLYKSSQTTLLLYAMMSGTAVSVGWTSPTLNAGTSYVVQIGYSGSGGNLELRINNVAVGTTTTLGLFGTVPTTIYYGTDSGGGGSNPYDATFDVPGVPSTVAVLATGEKIYPGGYKTTTDLPNSGLNISIGTTGGNDFVVRGVVNSDGTCVPKIVLSDYYAGVGETDFGSLTGTVGSGRTAPDVLIFTGEVPGSGAKTMKVKLVNTASSGSCYWHQVEVLNNLINNPSFDGSWSGADPNIPTGWTSSGLTAGMGTSDTSIFHSGSSSVKLTTSDAGKGLYEGFGFGDGNYYDLGAWYRTATTASLGDRGTARFKYQASNTGIGLTGVDTSSSWAKWLTVIRQSGASTSYVALNGASSGSVYYDDVYLTALSPVSLTVTPATGANSTESTGLRVDGIDTLTQAITGIGSSIGTLKWTYTPRHTQAAALSFGTTVPYIARFYSSTQDSIDIYWVSGGIRFNHRSSWSNHNSTIGDVSAVMSVGTSYAMEYSYTPASAQLKVNGVTYCSVASPGAFAGIPGTAYFGSDEAGGNQSDGTYKNFVSLTPTVNTTAPYYKFGSQSQKLVNSGVLPDEYAIGVQTTNTNTLSAYVYDGTTGNIGGTVASIIAQLSVGSTGIGTTYTDMGGGWWRLNGQVVGTNITQSYGIQVKAGKTVYLDGVQLEQKEFPSSYADGTLGVGYTWSGTANNSSTTRTLGTLTYNNTSNVSATVGAVSFWVKSNLGSNMWNDNTAHSWVLVTSDGATRIQKHSSNLIQMYWGGSNLTVDTSNYSQDRWYHIVGTWDDSANSAKLYVNNSAPQSGVYSTAAFDTLRIGSGGANSDISDLRIYNSAIGASDVSNLYWSGLQTHSDGSEGNTRYVSTGTYTSPVLDLGMIGGWGGVPWTIGSTANGGSISYLTRTSSDNVTWGDWVSTVGSTLVSDPRRYFQWKATLGSTSPFDQTPSVNSMTVAYVEDVTAPINPDQTALGYSAAVGTTALTSGEWYNYESPTFAWGTGVDTAAPGQSGSGIAGYKVLLTTNIGATPADNASAGCYKQTDADARSFRVGVSPEGCSLTNGTYYLRLQTYDNSGNISSPVTLFTYKYDGSTPNAPGSVSTTTIGYSADNSFTFYWPAVTDVGPAGLAGYEYKTGAGDTSVYSDWQFTTATTIEGVPAYTEGQNVFYVRSRDNAGNYSTATTNVGTATYYYNESAPTAVQNLAIAPTTTLTTPSSTNSFMVTWDKPATYSGDIAKYYYCVNCTPSLTTMTETTADQTALRKITAAALATQQGKNTFYIVAEDNNIDADTGHGNRNFEAYASVDFYASTVAPAAPSNLTISDASDRSATKWRLTLAWDVGDTTVTPDHYELYRSTDNETYTRVGTIAGTAYTDGSLAQSTLYYYKVRAIDNAGAASSYSNTVHNKPEGKYATPPSAGGVPSVTAGSSTATIKWSTGRNAYGTVEYGKTSSYGNAGAGSTATTSHSIKVTGLSPGTTYHYRVQSLDDSSLVGYERADANSADYTFTTLVSAAISEVKVDEVGLETAVVSWRTTSLSTSKVEYGETTEYGSSIEVSTTADESIHTARLTGLKNSTKYHYRVRGVDVDGNETVSDDYTLETITFPLITAYVLKTDQNAGGISVSVAWASNVETSSVVEYQKANIGESSVPIAELEKMNQADLAKIPVTISGEPEQVAKSDLVTTHLLKLSNLEDGKIYIVTMRGRDKYGNEAVSEPIRYVTGKDTRPPVVSNVTVETQISGSGTAATAQIIISWDTDEPGTTQVLYGAGVGTEYPLSSPEELGLTKRHTVVLRDLAHTSSYHLQIVSKDQTGNVAKSGDLIAVTPASQESALDVVLANLEDVFGFLKI